MKATELKCEYLKNPLGIDIINPRLSWIDEGVKTQSKAEVLYRINNGEEKTINVSSSDMSVKFDDRLRSRDFVTWKVRIYDENGNEGDLSEEAHFSLGLLEKEDWKAKWIKGDYKVSKKKRYPVDVFYKEFNVDTIKSAFLYVSALGLYEVYINEQKVGNFLLAPGSTDYRIRVQYDTYDVKDYLKVGKNTMHILLADGWYRGSIGAKGFTYVFGKETKVISQLEITDEKDNKSSVLSDGSFLWSNHSPILFADLKDGEIVDNNLKPTFTKHAIVSSYDGIMNASDSVHVEELESSSPIEAKKLPDNRITYTFKKNLAGNIAFTCNAKKGSKIDIYLGEILDENDVVTLRNVQCIRKGKKTPLEEIHFTCKEGRNEYKTKFFYGGFQYATVTLTGEIEDFEIRQIQVGSKLEETSTFECANNLINIFYRNTINSLKSNSVDIPTDCPTRERMGWTGDSQVFFNTASYITDYEAFSRKHIKDVFDRQAKNGCLPQIAPYSAEDWFMNVMNGSVGWADVGVLTPYRMYLKYGDKEILSTYYEDMVKYAKFMMKRCGRAKGIYAVYARPLHLSKENKKFAVNSGQSYGEWAEPGDVKQVMWTDFAMPHPEESMAYTVFIMETMIKISKILNRSDYLALFMKYRDGVKKAYQELVTKEAHTLDTDRQAKLVRPLKLNLLTDKQKEFAKKRLITALDHYRWRLGTGFLSTPFILDVLADIDPKYAYKLLLNEEMPGWLFMAKNDTGTIWEGWEGKQAQLGISSLNHYSKGAMVEWLFSGMLGINMDGDRHFLIKPIVDRRVPFARGSYSSVYGNIRVEWTDKEGKIIFDISVPSNTTATFCFNNETKELEAGNYHFEY